MKRNIITTSDGSKTIQIEEWNEQYHSIHGAIQEANHVFLKHGLLYFYSELVSESAELVSESAELVSESKSEDECHSEQRSLSVDTERSRSEVQVSRSAINTINILEIGFGTGLNAFLTLVEAEKLKLNINYVGVEAYPVSLDEINQLNYVDLISKPHEAIFEKLHQTSWETLHQITSNFELEKQQKFFKDISTEDEFNIIYFDAFGARVQPDLWTEDIFQIMFNALKENGVLVTYSAKGSVRRAMQAVGFVVERLPGPPGKREMLRATKKI